MQNRIAVLVGCMLALAVTQPCDVQAAEEAEATALLGRYVAAGLLYAVEDFDSDLDGDNSWGLSLRAGSRTGQHVAFGIEADYYHEFESDLGDLRGYSLFPVVRYYPLIGKIEPYATFGLGIYRLEGDNNAFGPGDDTAIEISAKLGGGVDFYVTDSVAVFADAAYIVADRDLGDAQSIPITLGVKYRLGAPD